MQQYIGTKIVLAKEMNRQEYIDYRGWELPEDEDGSDEGYLVEYTDSPSSIHPKHAGYISWSPKEQFYNAYRETDGMNFGLAIEALKKGLKVARRGWNGKGMFLVYVPGTDDCELREGTPYHEALNNEYRGQGSVTINAHIDMFTAQGCMQPGWLASQADMLSDDWEIVD